MTLKMLVIAAGVVAFFYISVPALAGEGGDRERGGEIFQLCGQCHGAEGKGNPALEVPSIAGLDQWYLEAQLAKFREGLRGSHPEDSAGLRMRPMALTLRNERDIVDVASYVAALPSVKPEPMLDGGNPEKGKQYFQVCMACHGPEAAGNQQLNAPRLNKASDWYLFAQLQHFRAGRRGLDPKDTTGVLMRPMSLTLPDEQAMRDVIAYIMTLSK